MIVQTCFAALLLPVWLQTAQASPSLKPVSDLATEFGRVKVDEADLAAAIAEGNAARAAARAVLGLPDARFEIVEAEASDAAWGSETREGRPLYSWAFRKSADGRSMPPPSFLLRHEIGHDLFIRYLVPSTRNGQYGGDAPDWLDEMAAIAFEGEALRAGRRGAAVRYIREKRLIPLGRFLEMQHPEAAAGPVPASFGKQFPLRDPSSPETELFYMMASSFYDYLVERTGETAIVAELAAEYRRGGRLDLWLVRRVGLSPSRKGIARLEVDFRHWIAADPRYRGGQK